MNSVAKLAVALLLAVAPGAPCAQEFSFRAFGPSDGLTNLGIKQIYQDRIGFLWVSTDTGIFRFDGSTFKAYGPAEGIPLFSASLFGDAPDGSLLVGGDQGLFRLSRSMRFERVAGDFQVVSWTQGIQADGSGHTYLGTDAGLVEMLQGTGENSYVLRAIAQPAEARGRGASGILADGDTVWYGCGIDLCQLSKQGTRLFARPNGLPEQRVQSIRKDRDRSLWVREEDGGVFVLPDGQSIFRKVNAPIPGAAINGPLAIDDDGNLLIPTAGGLLIHDSKSGELKSSELNRWRRIDSTSGMRGVVLAVYEDRQHTLWIGLQGRGLSRWRGYREWENYSSASGMASDYLYEILPEQKGVVWAGTKAGLVRGERGLKGMLWKSVTGLDNFPVHSVARGPDARLWLGTETHGIVRFDPETHALEQFDNRAGLPLAARTLHFDGKQRLWVATVNGLYWAAAPYRHFARVEELPPSEFRCIASGSDGTVWAGGADGLFSLSGKQWKHWTQADGVDGREVFALGEGADGSMWIGHRFGGVIDRIHPATGKTGKTSPWKVESGVERGGSNGIVYFLGSDAAGGMWAGTDHGLDRWDGNHWTHYGIEDGLIWDHCNLNSFAAQADGTVWFGTSSGLSRYTPKNFPPSSVPLTAVFTELTLGATDVTGQLNPSASARQNSLVARYTALNAMRGSSLLFRYRFEDSDSSWTVTPDRELELAKLAPGNYRLAIEAQDGNGIWSPQSSEFAFRILAPWYRTPWFFALCVLIPVLALTAIGRWVHLRMVRREREVQELLHAQAMINDLAFYDPLTGLPNRRLLMDRLHHTVADSAHSGCLHGFLFLDLDNFKIVNDTMGHSMGDRVLKEVAHRISAAARASDTVARLGGDEFVVLLEDLGHAHDQAIAKAERISADILSLIGHPFELDGREWNTSSCIGVAIFGAGLCNESEVLQQADIALYQAKSAGRNSIQFFDPALQTAINAHAELDKELSLAVRHGQFLVCYQPQFDRDKIVAVEALVRWQHPSRGMVSPLEFIPAAEQSGVIFSIGSFVLERVCRQIAAWGKRAETESISISANISAREFRSPAFVNNVKEALQRTGANPRRLTLELTESLFVEDFEDVLLKMTQLKQLGIRFSLDDFGTGYSSLNYLKRLPLDELKIDRLFVRDILDDVSSSAIARTIISLSKSLGLFVVAEGVENEMQRQLLAEMGCTVCQGFLFSRPIQLDEFEELLARQRQTPNKAGNRTRSLP